MVDYVRSKEGVSCKGLVLFPIKVANVSQPRGHGPAEGPLIAQVVPSHLHKATCAVVEILCGDDHMDPLVKQLSCLFLGEAILYHIQEDLYLHFMLLCICWSIQFWRFEKGGHPCGSVRVGGFQYLALEEVLVEGYWEVNIVHCIGQGTIRLYCSCILRIE